MLDQQVDVCKSYMEIIILQPQVLGTELMKQKPENINSNQ
jgi:hypothetical protein